MMSGKTCGTVCTVVPDKGYGFIAVDGKSNLFFHFRSLENRIFPAIGDRVLFSYGTFNNKECAVNICTTEFINHHSVHRRPSLNRPAVSSSHNRPHLFHPASSSRFDRPAGFAAARGEKPNYQVIDVGTVFHLKDKYGFISVIDERREQVHWFFDRRTERLVRNSGQIVQFSATTKPVIGNVATMIHPFQVPELSHRGADIARRIGQLTHYTPIAAEESRHWEFKSMENSNSHSLAGNIACYCDKYMNSFLNGDGGCMLLGIADDSTVFGVHLDQHHRDVLNREVDAIAHKSHPPIDGEDYNVDYHQVFNGKGQLLKNCFVVSVSVSKGSKHLYKTTKGEMWIRYDGSTRQMTAEMVAERSEAALRATQLQFQDLFTQMQIESKRAIEKQFMEMKETSIGKQSADALQSKPPQTIHHQPQTIQPLPLAMERHALAAADPLPPPLLMKRSVSEEQAMKEVVELLSSMGFDGAAAMPHLSQLMAEGHNILDWRVMDMVLEHLSQQPSSGSPTPGAGMSVSVDDGDTVYFPHSRPQSSPPPASSRRARSQSPDRMSIVTPPRASKVGVGCMYVCVCVSCLLKI